MQPVATEAPKPVVRPRRIRMPSGPNLVGILGVLISILITTGFLAYHAMSWLQLQCPPSLAGCPYLTPVQAAYQSTFYGLELLFFVAVDLGLGLSVALAFLAATRSDILESTRRSLFFFATVYLFVWFLVGLFVVPPFISVVRFY